MKYQYHVEMVQISNEVKCAATLEDVLNEFGGKGWKLIGVESIHEATPKGTFHYYRCIFEKS